jgi:hypothetical protein
VQVRVQAQILTPGMQYAYHAQLHSCLASKGCQRLPHGFKQHIVNHLRMLKRQGIELMRQSEHKVKISAGQKVCLPLLYPLFSFMSLTFWAMPVSATIIADADVAAAITCIYMSAQSRRAAVFEGTQGLLPVHSKAL